MVANLEEASAFGKWSDLWAAHPLPTMHEPEKAVCWLTPNSAAPSRAVARMALEAGLGAVDKVFQLTLPIYLHRPAQPYGVRLGRIEQERPHAASLEDFNRALADWLVFYNTQRPLLYPSECSRP
ncbi:MAG: hypothetical protein OXU43_06420 [Gammaproteobacteria bacterium]|nr:hypothetical protein [Gammaproteobacteria bacterium]